MQNRISVCHDEGSNNKSPIPRKVRGVRMVRSLLVVVLLVSVVTGAGEAQAQLFAPVVVVQEEWRPVVFGGTVSYYLDGKYHWVTNGAHWQTGENSSAQCANLFVEPFDSRGCRIVKAVGGFRGAEWSFQFGPKTYNVRNGETYFATWVSRGGQIQLVWVKIENPAPASIETTPGESPYSSEVEVAPMVEDLIPIPQRKNIPASPGPVVPPR